MPPRKTQTKTAAGSNPIADAMTGLNPMALQAWQEIMNESARFMTERLEKDIATQQAMLNCKSPADLMKVQADFFQDVLSDYSEGATRMLKLMAQANGTSRGYDDVPL